MKQKLITYIQTELLNEQHTITADQDLLISGLIDSIGVMRLVAFVEEEIQINIPPEDVTIEHFATIQTISSYVLGLEE